MTLALLVYFNFFGWIRLWSGVEDSKICRVHYLCFDCLNIFKYLNILLSICNSPIPYISHNYEKKSLRDILKIRQEVRQRPLG